MSEQRKKRLLIYLVVNIVVVIIGLVVNIIGFSLRGFSNLIYFTEQSNLLAHIASLVLSVYLVLLLKGKISKIPKWVNYFKFASVCGVLLTFMVVILILSPNPSMGGYKFMLFGGTMLFNHTLTPIIVVLSYILLDDSLLTFKEAGVSGIAHTLLYAVVFIILNVCQVTEGPYPFLMVYKQKVIVSILYGIGIPGISFLFGFLTWLLNKKAQAKVGELTER